MKVIRIYDDRHVFYNNVDWSSLCTNDILVEYCTLKDGKKISHIIEDSAKEKINETDECWDIQPNAEYFVFLDTKWDKDKIDNPHTFTNEIIIPQEIIHHLQNDSVVKIGVYSLYDLKMAAELINELNGVQGIIDKVVHYPFNFHLFQPDEIVDQISAQINNP